LPEGVMVEVHGRSSLVGSVEDADPGRSSQSGQPATQVQGRQMIGDPSIISNTNSILISC
jgi:hypothetical protein